MAAFIALTAFASQLDDTDLKHIFPALTFLAAALLGLELEGELPDRPRHWRLEAFSLVLGLLVILMGWYWFSTFPVVWIPALFQLIQIVVLLGLAVLFTQILSKAIGFIAVKLFKREITAPGMIRVSQIVFVFGLLLVLSGLIWTSRRLAGRSIKIHIPFTSENPVGNTTHTTHDGPEE